MTTSIAIRVHSHVMLCWSCFPSMRMCNHAQQDRHSHMQFATTRDYRVWESSSSSTASKNHLIDLDAAVYTTFIKYNHCSVVCRSTCMDAWCTQLRMWVDSLRLIHKCFCWNKIGELYTIQTIQLCRQKNCCSFLSYVANKR